MWELHTDEPMLDMRFFRNPAFSTGTGGMILVFLAMYGVMFLITQYFQLVLGYSPLGAALRFLPMAPIMIIVAPLTPRLSARFGANRTVAVGMCCVAVGLLLFRGLGLRHVRTGTCSLSPRPARRRHRAGDVADDRGDHVGGAAAAGRCRLGHERRDPRARRRPGRRGARQHRRLAATRVHVDRADQRPARRHAGGGPHLARRRARRGRRRCPAGPATVAPRRRPARVLRGIHLAVTIGAVLALVAAVIVFRYLPRHLAAEGAMHGPVEAMEDAAELGLAGIPPVFADGPDDTAAEVLDPGGASEVTSG